MMPKPWINSFPQSETSRFRNLLRRSLVHQENKQTKVRLKRVWYWASMLCVGGLANENWTTGMEQTQPSAQALPPDPKQHKAPSQATKATDSSKGLNHSFTPLPQLNTNTGQKVPANAPNPPPTQQNTQTNANTPYRLTLPQAAVQQGVTMPNNISSIIQQTSNKGPSGSATITTNPISNTASPQSNIIPDFTSYISAPTTERIARLENWICEHIQDDDFLRLCQDVEGVWKRVAFGGWYAFLFYGALTMRVLSVRVFWMLCWVWNLPFFYWVNVLKCSFSPFLFHEVHEFVMYLYVILPVSLSCMHV